jgi:uncharacterized protein (DUF924 family)
MCSIDRVMHDKRSRAVLDFWFLPRRHHHHGKFRDLWYSGESHFDAEIARRFGRDIERALEGRNRHWMATPRGALALCLLLDQFTRNAFRGTARAFSGDGQARRVARYAIARRFDRRLPLQLRKFLYLPFEHSETLGDQHRCIGLFSQLHPPQDLWWAVHHRDIVARFGRFPHRNAALGRADSEAERAYLASDHERFGQ